MNIPALTPSSRSREFNLYSQELHAQTIRAWLFDGLTHRQIDGEVLGLDPKKSKGYQSMGILHHLGLKGATRGVFEKHSIESAIRVLSSSPHDFSSIINILGKSTATIHLDAYRQDEQNKIAKSLKSSSAERIARINSTLPPKCIKTIAIIYARNPDVVAEALFRANGVCEKCKSHAPFLRKSDNSPYLEVHHVIPLSDGGSDNLDNVLALCPNCHRRYHHGTF